MGEWILRLVEDRLGGGAWLALPERIRVLYAVEGEAVVTHGGRADHLAAGGAWHGTGPCAVTAARGGARVWRWELAPADPAADPSWPGVLSHPRLEHPLALDPHGAYLIRCDRVEFAPGAEARPHRHRGGGIRCLLAGALEVRIGDGAPRVMRPGDAWFESGQEPVHAVAARDEPTSFVRVAVLPREVLGRPSIVYVDPADAAATPRRYHVFVDAPIELAR